MDNRDIVIKGKGIRIHVLSAIFIVIGVITMIAAFVAVKHIYGKYNDAEASYQLIEVESEKAAEFKAASDYLTDQARKFAVMGELENAENYFVEKNEIKRRESSLEQIGNHHEFDFESNLLGSAMELSEALVEYEIHAMKLIAEVEKIDPAQLPDEVASFELPENEKGLDDAEKQNLAIRLLYDEEYEEYKSKINWNVDSAIVLIKDEAGTRYLEDEADLIVLMNVASSLVIVLFTLLLLIFIFDTLLVVRPVKKFVQALDDKKKLPVIGGYELRKFARRYDEIYGSDWKNKELLKEQGEVDELTGTMKASTLEYMRSNLSKSDESLGIMLVDIDNFRSIKETSGYEMGDKVVAKVARQLITLFQGGDYIVRTSQDSFEIFLNKMKSDKSEMLVEKIAQVNTNLADSTDGVAAASVSAGVAFSDKGYTEETERKADMALTYVKGNGRGACKIM